MSEEIRTFSKGENLIPKKQFFFWIYLDMKLHETTVSCKKRQCVTIFSSLHSYKIFFQLLEKKVYICTRLPVPEYALSRSLLYTAAKAVATQYSPSCEILTLTTCPSKLFQASSACSCLRSCFISSSSWVCLVCCSAGTCGVVGWSGCDCD